MTLHLDCSAGVFVPHFVPRRTKEEKPPGKFFLERAQLAKKVERSILDMSGVRI